MTSNALPWSTEISFADDLVFIGAQTAGDATLTLQAQTEAVIARLNAILESAGMTLGDAVKLGVFYHQSVLNQEAALLAKLRILFVEGPVPVLTAIPLHHLPEGALVQIELIGLKPGSARAIARKTASADAVDGFSKAIRCDDLIFIGGKMSFDERGKLLHPGDIVAQARATMDALKSAIRELGADPQSVVKLNTYYVGFGTTEDWTMAARVRSDAFVKPGPGATGVPVPGPYPAGLLLRQEAIAIVNEDGSPKHRDTSWPEGNWNWPIPVSFEQGLKLGNHIVLGGQISATLEGEAVYPGDYAAQARRTMETIQEILAGFGKNCDCLAKLTIFYATEGNPADRAIVLNAVRPFFSRKLPALTMVPLAKLGFAGLELEIEGIGIDS